MSSPLTFKIKELNIDLIAPSTKQFENPEKGGSKIVVIGKPGTGKTTLITSVLYEKKHIFPIGMCMSGTEDSNGYYRKVFPSTFVFNKLNEDKIESFINSQKNDFSYIFIDCPPSLSLLTIMALVVAKSLIVPLQAEFFALEGLSQLMKTINRIKIKLNPNLNIRGVLLTMFDKRNKLSSQVDMEARKFFQNKVYQTVIPRNVRLSEAPSHGVPVLIYDKTCMGSKSYFGFTEEFLKHENIMESAA